MCFIWKMFVNTWVFYFKAWPIHKMISHLFKIYFKTMCIIAPKIVKSDGLWLEQKTFLQYCLLSFKNVHNILWVCLLPSCSGSGYSQERTGMMALQKYDSWGKQHSYNAFVLVSWRNITCFQACHSSVAFCISHVPHMASGGEVDKP